MSNFVKNEKKMSLGVQDNEERASWVDMGEIMGEVNTEISFDGRPILRTPLVIETI